MAHDGQDQFLTQNALLKDLIDQTGRSAEVVNVVLERAIETVRSKVSQDGRVSATLIELNQTAAHGLAWLATYVESLKQMQKWAETLQTEGRFGETEQLILQISFGEYLNQILGGIPMSQNEIVRLSDLGLTSEDTAVLADDSVMALVSNGNVHGARLRLVELMQENNADVIVGASGLDEELEMIREQFRRYSLDRIEPVAHEWHLNDELIPMEIIEELAELGVFGLTIPEEYDGLGMSKASMAVVSEELSRGYIGVGSLGTRSEIAAELILCGGTEEQKAHWLPKIASAEILPTAVFTEPNTGSDLGALRTRAVKDGADYRITGNKTWITHASRNPCHDAFGAH